MANSLMLNWETWDIELDGSGYLTYFPNENDSIAQDVACAVRVFLNEVWYNTTLGMPYYQQILGENPPASLVTAKAEAQALTVQDVETATVVMLGLDKTTRKLSGIMVVNSDIVVTI